jgi:hypothetical protein
LLDRVKIFGLHSAFTVSGSLLNVQFYLPQQVELEPAAGGFAQLFLLLPIALYLAFGFALFAPPQPRETLLSRENRPSRVWGAALRAPEADMIWLNAPQFINHRMQRFAYTFSLPAQ